MPTIGKGGKNGKDKSLSGVKAKDGGSSQIWSGSGMPMGVGAEEYYPGGKSP